MRIFLLLAVLFSFCSCAHTPFQVRCEPIRSFSCTASCKYGEDVFVFALTSAGDGSCSAAVLQPQTLDGVVFYADADGIAADANGLRDALDTKLLPCSAPIRLLFDSLHAFLYTGTETLTAGQDGSFSATQSVNGIACNAVFSEQGQLLQIRCPLYDAAMDFTYN